MARTRNYRDLVAWQKAMELARLVYAATENFPNSETFGLRMQMRRSAIAVAAHIADGHGKLSDIDLKRSLGQARGTLFEFETQTQLAIDLKFVDEISGQAIQERSTTIAKLINGLIGVLEVEPRR